jgi:SWI/SNF-related matrix-associated actin-dependent regulator 1 of chromatin subfamily A
MPDNSSSGELSMIDLPENNLNTKDSGLIYTQPDFIPKGLALKSYQLLGVSWLNLLYEKNLSGILADEMGLGKTAQVISFLGYLKSQGIKGPHLIVAPSSTLENWAREIERWAPTLNYQIYHGTMSERGEAQYDILQQAEDLNVVLTTYTMATGNKDDRVFLRKIGCTSIILDEGHMIKNMESARYKYLSMYKAKFRLLMTGTPLQNNLMELLSLLTFIMPDLFTDELGVLSKIFTHKKSTGSTTDNLLCKQRVVRAKEMMTPFVLRRRKDQVLKELPQKLISIQKCDQTPHQKAVYDLLFAESRRNYLESENMKHDTKGSSKKLLNSSKALTNCIMEFRKAANHPLLFRHYYTNDILSIMAKKILMEPEYCDANQGYIYEDMQFMSDFELHQLCKKFKSISSYKLCDNEWMDSGKVKHLSIVLPEMKSKV